jgi:hypothetical protein
MKMTYLQRYPKKKYKFASGHLVQSDKIIGATHLDVRIPADLFEVFMNLGTMRQPSGQLIL